MFGMLRISIPILLVTFVIFIHSVESSSHGPSSSSGIIHSLPGYVEDIHTILGDGEELLEMWGLTLSKARERPGILLPLMENNEFYHYRHGWVYIHPNVHKKMYERVVVSPQDWLNNLTTYAINERKKWILRRANKLYRQYMEYQLRAQMMNPVYAHVTISNPRALLEYHVEEEANTLYPHTSLPRGIHNNPLAQSRSQESTLPFSPVLGHTSRTREFPYNATQVHSKRPHEYTRGDQAQSSRGENYGSQLDAESTELDMPMSLMNLHVRTVIPSESSPDRRQGSFTARIPIPDEYKPDKRRRSQERP